MQASQNKAFLSLSLKRLFGLSSLLPYLLYLWLRLGKVLSLVIGQSLTASIKGLALVAEVQQKEICTNRESFAHLQPGNKKFETRC